LHKRTPGFAEIAISGIFTQPDLSPEVTFGNFDFVMISGTYVGQMMLPRSLS
jgi:hypothetical protein